MADKIKAGKRILNSIEQARSIARGEKKEEDQTTWFENHIIVMPGMHEHVTVVVDKEQEEKLKQSVSGRTFTEQTGD
jgi:hypothetical protein